MAAPADRRYTESHEWAKAEGDVVTLGVTQFAVDQLTDVTYVEPRPAGTEVNPGDAVAEVESVKTTSDVYSPVAGEIVEVNPALDENPGLLNEDPYGAGWLVKVRTADASPLEALMDAAAYESQNAG